MIPKPPIPANIGVKCNASALEPSLIKTNDEIEIINPNKANRNILN